MGTREIMRGLRETNMPLYNPDHVEGKWDMPVIEDDWYIPFKMIGFNEAMSSRSIIKGRCVHFYMDDVQFQRIWHRPYNYVNKLRKYSGMLSPDFSVYRDMPRCLQIYNVYRNRLIGQYMQNMGVKVIPTVSWGDESTYDFCFDGIREHAVVSVATIGVVTNKESRELWRQGVEELVRRKRPRTIIFYGIPLDFNSGESELIYFESTQMQRFNELHGRNEEREAS